MDSQGMAVFPVVLSIIPRMVFNKRNPIILGCDVLEGTLKVALCRSRSIFLLCTSTSFAIHPESAWLSHLLHSLP